MRIPLKKCAQRLWWTWFELAAFFAPSPIEHSLDATTGQCVRFCREYAQVRMGTFSETTRHV